MELERADAPIPKDNQREQDEVEMVEMVDSASSVISTTVKLLSSSLTVDSQVDGVLPVPRRERGVLADVCGLVGQPQRGEGDGGVLQSGRAPPHRAALERHAVPVGRRHRHAQRGIDDGHVLLGAVDQFLPGHLEGGGRRSGGQQGFGNRRPE